MHNNVFNVKYLFNDFTKRFQITDLILNQFAVGAFKNIEQKE